MCGCPYFTDFFLNFFLIFFPQSVPKENSVQMSWASLKKKTSGVITAILHPALSNWQMSSRMLTCIPDTGLRQLTTIIR